MNTVDMLERLAATQNAHDAAAMAALFAVDYRSEQPAHPARAFVGSAQVRKNWTAMFEGVRDFRARLIDSATSGDTVWGEWEWTGTHPDGPFHMRGVMILVVRDGLIQSGRLFMEPVEAAGAAIEEAVRDLAGVGDA